MFQKSRRSYSFNFKHQSQASKLRNSKKYSAYTQNLYKRHLGSIPPKKHKILSEDIHIVMCCWKRFQNLGLQFNMLNNQTLSKNIHLHLVNNNYNEREKLEKIVNALKKIYTHIKVSVSHYKNEYSCFQRYFYIKEQLLKKYKSDYVIIIDDDQIFHPLWIEKMWNLRKPKIYTGWYCKKWMDNHDYWDGAVIGMVESQMSTKKHIKHADYIGPGGCLIDTTIFHDNSSFWNIPTDLPTSIYDKDDLWLSFIAKYEHKYILERSFLPEYRNTNYMSKQSNDVSLCNKLGDVKQILFKYLIKKYSV